MLGPSFFSWNSHISDDILAGDSGDCKSLSNKTWDLPSRSLGKKEQSLFFFRKAKNMKSPESLELWGFCKLPWMLPRASSGETRAWRCTFASRCPLGFYFWPRWWKKALVYSYQGGWVHLKGWLVLGALLAWIESLEKIWRFLTSTPRSV